MIDPPTSHTITVDASEQDHLIDSVTVFPGRAEIKRRVQLQLKRGQNQITIESLPTCLGEDSLRVQGTGTATIFDVVYHHPQPTHRYNHRHIPVQALVESDNGDDEAEDDEEIELYNSVEALKKQCHILENQISFLDGYGRSVDAQNSNIESLERFLDAYGTRRDALDKKIQEMNLEVNRAEKALQAVQKKKKPAPKREFNVHRQTKITVTVMSKEEGKAELMLAYVVSNASWTPIYEIRALISSSPNSPSTITLHYRASLTQTTGEDWPDIALTLSTATPYRGTHMPTLSTWRIGIPVPAYQSRDSPRDWRSLSPQTHVIRVGLDPQALRERSRSPTQIIRVGGSPGSTEIVEDYAPMAVRQADGVDAGVLSATFSIPGRSNIPSDQGSHKVLIASLNFQVDPEWFCIPRKDESVFLRCQVVNSSEFMLLPGKASIFIGDNFVSKSRIEHVPPNDSFQLSFGVDPAVRVTYAPVHTHKRTDSQSGFSFPGRQKQPKQAKTKYTQSISIRNTRSTVVPSLHILDHVPVSNDSTIKVNIIAPPGLRENERPAEDGTTEKQYDAWTRPQTGVRARWAPPDMGGDGAIEWMCALGAGAEMELKMGWEVSAPEGTKWESL